MYTIETVILVPEYDFHLYIPKLHDLVQYILVSLHQGGVMNEVTIVIFW